MARQSFRNAYRQTANGNMDVLYPYWKNHPFIQSLLPRAGKLVSQTHVCNRMSSELKWFCRGLSIRDDNILHLLVYIGEKITHRHSRCMTSSIFCRYAFPPHKKIFSRYFRFFFLVALLNIRFYIFVYYECYSQLKQPYRHCFSTEMTHSIRRYVCNVLHMYSYWIWYESLNLSPLLTHTHTQRHYKTGKTGLIRYIKWTTWTSLRYWIFSDAAHTEMVGMRKKEGTSNTENGWMSQNVTANGESPNIH